MQTVKCMLVGDTVAGKSYLLMTYTSSSSFSYYTVMENHSMTVVSGGKPVTLELWDTMSMEGYDRIRRMLFPQIDVFLVCYSVVCPTSYDNVIQRWIPEITNFCPNIPFLLVGTRTDLRNDDAILKKLAGNKERPFTPQDGEKLARKGKAVKYMECSAETKEGLNELFDAAISVALERRDDKSKKTCLLL